MRISLILWAAVAQLWIVGCVLSHSTSKVYVGWNHHTNKYNINEKSIPDPVAWAVYENAINQTGWSFLEVYTSSNYEDTQQSYAAGLAEGFITRDILRMHFHNTYEGYCSRPLNAFCQKLETYLQKNLEWMQEQMTQEHVSDYWHQAKLFMDQLSGLVDGYAGRPGQPGYKLDVTGLILIQLSGDLEDLTEALGFGKSSERIVGSGRCSALVKLLSDGSDLYTSQDTWNGYNSMLRILKKYDFPFKTTAGSQRTVPGSVMTFSSYPGLLLSGDDFYILSSGMVTQETTIGNGNKDLWKYVQPEFSVIEGIRNMIANRLANNGEEWVKVFSYYNSGTYNNEWMVIDYKTFQPGTKLQSGLLYVLEQIPGMIHYEDMTPHLQTYGYWASYNTPYFPDIFNASGGWDSVKKYGDWFSWEHTPRANIFRRDQGKVKDIDSMIKLMRYNDYKNDPLSKCNCTPPYSAENAISARSDLNPQNGSYPFSALGYRAHGGTDMKMTTSSMIKALQFIAVSSPTYDDQVPFQWSKSSFKDSHEGHPDLWTFIPLQHQWGYRENN